MDSDLKEILAGMCLDINTEEYIEKRPGGLRGQYVTAALYPIVAAKNSNGDYPLVTRRSMTTSKAIPEHEINNGFDSYIDFLALGMADKLLEGLRAEIANQIKEKINATKSK